MVGDDIYIYMYIYRASAVVSAMGVAGVLPSISDCLGNSDMICYVAVGLIVRY